MTEAFEQGVKFILSPPGTVQVPNFDSPEFTDFAEGLAFTSRIRYVLDQMRPEPGVFAGHPIPDKDVPVVDDYYVVKNDNSVGNFYRRCDFTSEYQFRESIEFFAKNPDYRVYPVRLQPEYKK